MRWGLLACALFVSVALAGCTTAPDIGGDGAAEAAGLEIDPEGIELPDGANLTQIADGYRIQWSQVDVPFETEAPIPVNATVVNATATTEADARVWVNVTAPDTEMRRCVPRQRVDWDTNLTGTASCAAATGMDDLPTTWSVTVESTASTTADVQVDLLSVEPDGLVGGMNLSAISRVQHEVDDLQSEVTRVASHDGTQLKVETIKPDVEEPLPAVLISTPRLGSTDEQVKQQVEQVPDPAPLARELAVRGYAVVVADVRGFGGSGGCVDMWGQLEQQDQQVLVEWVAEQNWSTDAVGMVGTGYAATTALEGAVQAPSQLKAVVAYAPVADAYRDWHFGGVPNGESMAGPVASTAQAATGFLGADDTLTKVTGSQGEGCDAGGPAEANDPRAVYNAFYEARNLTAKAGQAQAAVLYAQGTLDRAVKPSMAPALLGEISAPKLGLVGPWSHGPPTRADQVLLMLGWLDEHVKGKQVGLQAAAKAQGEVSAVTQGGLAVAGSSFPPADAPVQKLYPDFDAGKLAEEPTDGSAEILLDPTGELSGAAGGQANATTELVLEREIQEPTMLTGRPKLPLAATLQGFENAFVFSKVYDVAPDGTRKLVTFGMANLAHEQGHSQYTPVQPGQLVERDLPMQPTNHVFQPEHKLEIVIRSATSSDWTLVQPPRPGSLVLQGGEGGTALLLQQVPTDQVQDAPATAMP